jgi:predicted phage terminase large subunit-like protein
MCFVSGLITRTSSERYGNWRRDRANKILIEDKASGTQLIQDLKADGIYAITAYQPPSGTDKIMRLHAQTAIFENGRVLLPRRASWLSDYITELTSFPGSRHDDQVDSTTQALDHLRCHSQGYWFKLITPEVLAKAGPIPLRKTAGWARVEHPLVKANGLLAPFSPGISKG